ncbi:hypothetical protein [Bdellovibrio sp. HCB2-146]|uniref:hypothetical protein n=1 Tax=Bdellovibrio sp. HCB2-146 TaxID=3394362 RepID=UPI0039BC95F4
MKYILCLLLLVPTSFIHASWDLNDVSYLMPMPSVIGDDNLLGTAAPGKGGSLIPDRIVKALPILAMGLSREEAAETLRVVGVRIDPCFPLPTPQSCQRQIRFVWQPLEIDRRTQEVRTIDAALHTFYVLTDAEFSLLLKDIQAWKTKFEVKTQGLPLNIHPAWAKQGDKSPSLTAFHEIIKKYAGSGSMTRLTIMVLRGNADMWMFAGFDVKGDTVTNQFVPRLDRKAQTFINMAVPRDHFSGGGIQPAPSGEDTLNKLAFESIQMDEPNTEETIRKEVRAAFRIENPKVFNPENMDCVSCHVAQPVKHWVLNKRPGLEVEKLWSADIYRNARYDMTNVTARISDTHRIRAFGYFDDGPAISQRVINESAEVADALNQYLLF